MSVFPLLVLYFHFSPLLSSPLLSYISYATLSFSLLRLLSPPPPLLFLSTLSPLSSYPPLSLSPLSSLLSSLLSPPVFHLISSPLFPLSLSLTCSPLLLLSLSARSSLLRGRRLLPRRRPPRRIDLPHARRNPNSWGSATRLR